LPEAIQIYEQKPMPAWRLPGGPQRIEAAASDPMRNVDIALQVV